jgi:acyl carrier protein
LTKEIEMELIDEMKDIMLTVGVEERVVKELSPYLPLAGHVLDSLGYAEFMVAVEEYYGVKFFDSEAIFVRSLSDVKKEILAKRG